MQNIIEIKGYDGYYFSFSKKLFGVISKRTGEILKPRKDIDEMTYRLYKDGVPEDVSILKILAIVTPSLSRRHDFSLDSFDAPLN